MRESGMTGKTGTSKKGGENDRQNVRKINESRKTHSFPPSTFCYNNQGVGKGKERMDEK